ncbi:hypothetical protein MKK69_07920 [Methylobacterium sp. J-026]|uniref:beta strand repeat-containing protein n=1 Tax=Methylobacterium sp. J-026 TaxID=2836624 RepID=UPI001FB8E0BE|nr:carbohydrate-binding domain-containing protein [Methylobacterium sp. J-026]MCJ2133992.1 hypothetical protein [Methylobacterium sp. J-026]
MADLTYGGQTLSGHMVEGYVSGATVFADANGNGVLDTGEASSITDALGQYFLQNASGPLIGVGGVDTSTGQTITTTLTAPAGATVITPLTTLISALLPSNPSAADVTAAESTVAKGLGITLASGQSLLTLDPVAGTLSGDAAATQAYVAGAKVYDTISILSAGLSSQGGVSAAAASGSIAAALGHQIQAAAGSGQALNLSAASTLQNVVTAAATSVGANISTGTAASISTIAASSNTALDTAATGAGGGQQLLSSSAAVQQVAQGATTSALSSVPAGQSLSSVETQYTGSNLSNAIGSATVGSGGSGSSPFSTTVGTGPDHLVLKVSQDAYQGNAQYTVSVDGQQIGGTLTASGAHVAGSTAQDDTVTVQGSFGAGPHTVSVNFLNDAYNGPGNDRNLYVDSASYNGTAVSDSSLSLLYRGTQEFTVPQGTSTSTPGTGTSGSGTPGTGTSGGGSSPVSTTVGTGPDHLVLKVSQDAYQGDAQYTVSVDGKQVGGTLTASGAHVAGSTAQDDTVTVQGSFGTGPHTVSVNFLNDAYNGPGNDRNLYVDSASYNGASVSDSSLSLLNWGTQEFTVPQGTSTLAAGTSTLAAGTSITHDTMASGSNYNPSYLAGSQSTLYSGSAGDTLYGGLSAGAHDTLTAGSGDDLLSVKYGDNVLRAGSGLDTLQGGVGHDTLYGGGQSALYAGSGGDTLYGGQSAAAHDTLNSGAGNDFLSVSQGNNVLFGGAGLDTLQGGTGHDTLYGGGQSAMYAGSGGDTLYGGLGTGAHDTLMGGAGNDLLSVTQGNNALYASGGTDTLHAGSGDDTLYAGSGDAKLYGGSGHTRFEITGLTGNDTIVGGTGSASVVIDGHSSTDAQYRSNGDGSTTITFAGSSQSVTVTNIDTLHFGGNNTDHKIG